MGEYFYSYSVHCCDFKGFYDLRSGWDIDSLDYVLEDAAEDYHDNHDGWDDSWPVKIYIFKDEKLIGSGEVERESRPHFSVSEVKNVSEG